MHIHILGICGTFMGSLAVLAKALGHRVTGSDANVYPPMSTQLEAQGIDLMQGYDPAHLQPAPDLVIIGNAMSRGNPAVEYVLNQGIQYVSGPQWIAEHVLHNKHVLAVSGTHGKTTTSSMLAWLLHQAQIDCGYLIGGVPKNFDVSAQLGSAPFFVIEADEYDSAFFDKRSKFVHYRPRTLILNNLEFDHADIFDDLAAIQKQFHHVIRTVPAEGSIIYPVNVAAIEEVIEKGCWSQQLRVDFEENAQVNYFVKMRSEDGSAFDIFSNDTEPTSEISTASKQPRLIGSVDWQWLGLHNVQNGLAAFIAALQAGVSESQALAGLNSFAGVKRRLEKIAEINDIAIFDDFAHHPTAIASTLAGMRANTGAAKLLAVIEPRSNTMRLGTHQDELLDSVKHADAVYWLKPQSLDWDMQSMLDKHAPSKLFNSVQDIVKSLKKDAKSGDQIVIMSNGGFGGIHQLLVDSMQ